MGERRERKRMWVAVWRPRRYFLWRTPAGAGGFHLHVRSLTPLALAALALVAIASPAAPATSPMAFENREIGYDVAEPTLGITPEGVILVQANLDVVESRDEGRTWRADFTAPTLTTLDPYIHVDPVTGLALSSQLYGACQTIWRRDPAVHDGLWAPLAQCAPGDHQKLGSGPWPAALAPTAAYPRAVYTCSNAIAGQLCSVSRDGGITWGPQTLVTAGVAPTERGLFSDVVAPGVGVGGVCSALVGDPQSGPDGTIYVPREYCGRPWLSFSRDAGVTWEGSWVAGDARALPVGFGANNPSVSVDDAGVVYYAWTGDDWLHHVARSVDGGVTWDASWTVSAPGVGSTTFPLVIAGAPGRVATAYVGTRDTTLGPDLAPNETRWDLFVAYTLDADAASPTWSHVQVTLDALQLGCIARHGGCGGSQNLLDFNDLALLPDGRLAIVYTDGCDGCLTHEESSSRGGVLAVQVEGPRLRG